MKAAPERWSRLLAAHPDIDGVFAASDNMAAGALRTLRAAGSRVPEDVAVVGFDDLDIARQTEPALTTVSQPIRALGHEMATMLVRLIDGDSPTPIILPTHLVVRGSAPGAPTVTRGVARRGRAGADVRRLPLASGRRARAPLELDGKLEGGRFLAGEQRLDALRDEVALGGGVLRSSS